MARRRKALIFHPYFPFVLILIIVGLGLIHEQLQQQFAPVAEQAPSSFTLDQKINQSLAKLEKQDLALTPGRFSIDILPLSISQGESDLDRLLRPRDRYSGTYVYWYDDGNESLTYTMSASGIDGLQKIVHTYLEGYEPFRADNVMIPLYVLSQRKRYQLDARHYFGRQDVWQSSRQAFYYTRGDCEDHALILADWLMAMGEDARVVIGDWNGQGHAWVLLFKNGKEYLLEATEKSGTGRTHLYPLASLQTLYWPEYMFNDSYFWVNTGSRYTTRYSGSGWEKRSRFNHLD